MAKPEIVNPYTLFLGISSETTSPNFYELLGIAEDTDDPAAILAAATEQNRKLMGWQTNDEYHQAAKNMMQEVAVAQMVLRDPKKRQEYNQQLGIPNPQDRETQKLSPDTVDGKRRKNTQTRAVELVSDKQTGRLNIYALLLGLPEHLRAPNHYELLGIETFTNDISVIKEAVAEQHRKLLHWQDSAKYRKAAKRVAREWLIAVQVLTDQEKKLEYDQQLGGPNTRDRESQPPPPETVKVTTRKNAPTQSNLSAVNVASHQTGQINKYAIFLGVPADVIEPDYYELLGIKKFTDDLATIRDAANEQQRKLFGWQHVAKHAQTITGLIQEVQLAVHILTNKERKDKYDLQIGREIDLPDLAGCLGPILGLAWLIWVFTCSFHAPSAMGLFGLSVLIIIIVLPLVGCVLIVAVLIRILFFLGFLSFSEDSQKQN